MTHEEAKKLLPAFTAFVNKEPMQMRHSGWPKDVWQDTTDFRPESDWEYRVKPKPREWDIVIRRDGAISLHRSVPPGFVMSGDELIHVVEDMHYKPPTV